MNCVPQGTPENKCLQHISACITTSFSAPRNDIRSFPMIGEIASMNILVVFHIERKDFLKPLVEQQIMFICSSV